MKFVRKKKENVRTFFEKVRKPSKNNVILFVKHCANSSLKRYQSIKCIQ